MFAINTDNHLHCKKSHIMRYCVQCFKQVDSKLKSKHVEAFIDDIMVNYFSSNDFHNFKHAFEVFQMAYSLLRCNAELSQTERKLVLIAALCHDMNHIGLSNNDLKMSSKSAVNMRMLKRVRNRRSARILLSYNDVIDRSYSYDRICEIPNTDSFNELVHIKQTMVLLSKHLHNLFKMDGLFDIESIHAQMTSLILATDLQLHNKYIETIQDNIGTTPISFMLLIIKLADVSHTCRPFHIHVYWVLRLLAEKQKQNEIEVEDLLKFLAQDTIFFMKTFVEPLLSLWSKYHDQGNCQEHHINLRSQFYENLITWETYL